MAAIAETQSASDAMMPINKRQKDDIDDAPDDNKCIHLFPFKMHCPSSSYSNVISTKLTADGAVSRVDTDDEAKVYCIAWCDDVDCIQ